MSDDESSSQALLSPESRNLLSIFRAIGCRIEGMSGRSLRVPALLCERIRSKQYRWQEDGQCKEITAGDVFLDHAALNLLFDEKRFNTLLAEISGYTRIDNGVCVPIFLQQAVEDGQAFYSVWQDERSFPRAPAREGGPQLEALKLLLYVYPLDPLWEAQ